MKHLLNNMSEEEKNSIREQHTGGMKVMTENFNKLLSSKLGDSKPLTEQTSPKPDVSCLEKAGYKKGKDFYFSIKRKFPRHNAFLRELRGCLTISE